MQLHENRHVKRAGEAGKALRAESINKKLVYLWPQQNAKATGRNESY